MDWSCRNIFTATARALNLIFVRVSDGKPPAASASHSTGQAASIPSPIPVLNSLPHEPTPAAASQPHSRRVYLAVLTWAFTLFNSVRMLSYLPTIWAIYASGDSSQHSLWTWGTWLGANATMAAWLYEQNGQRMSRAVAVNLGNATMCATTVTLIVAHRGWPF